MQKEKKQAERKKREVARRLGKPRLRTNSYEDVIANDVVSPDEIGVDMEAIGDMRAVKRDLFESVIFPFHRPDLFEGAGELLTPPKGVLLYGPPGTGKTMLAKALAKESQACFINVRLATLQSKWYGDAQKLVTAIFTLATKLQPAIIFVDEIDSLLGRRSQRDHEASLGIKTEFMSLWDGLLTDKSARLIVIGATNRPWDIDQAALRRMERCATKWLLLLFFVFPSSSGESAQVMGAREARRSMEVPMPGEVEREQILRSILQDHDLAPNLDLRSVARQAVEYSGSDLHDLCKEVAMEPVREAMTGHGQEGERIRRPLTKEDFDRAVQRHKPCHEAAVFYEQKEQGRHGDLAEASAQSVLDRLSALAPRSEQSKEALATLANAVRNAEEGKDPSTEAWTALSALTNQLSDTASYGSASEAAAALFSRLSQAQAANADPGDKGEASGSPSH